ncbi:TPA: hypothetical protein ACGZ99_003554 [Elizabethkingia anophelis]
MKEKQQEQAFRPKALYVPPEIQVIMIEMECGIAAASATVIPINTSNQVQEEWTDGTNEIHDTPW